MKTNLISLIFLCLCASLQAQQSTLRGVVAIFNSKFETGKTEYVANAQVEEEFDHAQPAMTDADGLFRLVLVGIADQSSVQFTVKKHNLEVVNTGASRAVANQRERVKIYMAPPGKIADYRKKYYQVGKTSAEKSLEDKVLALQTERARLKTDEKAHEKRIGELEAQIATLETQRNKIDEAAKELARRYAPVNLDDTSPAYREAFSAFQQGDLAGALSILQTADYAGQARNILRERDSIRTGRERLALRDSVQQQRTRDAIQCLSLQADLFKTNMEFDSTARCYEIMLLLDSANVGVLRQYAAFLASQNKHNQAVIYYKKALLNAQAEDVRAAILNNLGNARRADGQLTEAGADYAAALDLFRKLSATHYDEFAPFVALTLNNLGNYYRKRPDSDNFYDAMAAFKEALGIYEQLDKTNNHAYQPYTALTLNNLGRVYYDAKKMRLAKQAFENSLDIYERLAQNNPAAIIPGDIQEFVDLSLTYGDQDKSAYIFDKYSEALLNRALDVHRKLAEKNPALFLPFTALTLHNLGNLYFNHYKFDRAETAFAEALKIHRELASKNPNTFYPMVAQNLRSMSKLYAETRRSPLSETALAEAAEIEKKYGRK